MKTFAQIVSTPEEKYQILSSSMLNHDHILSSHWSDSTIHCNDLSWKVHNVFICGQSDFFVCALSGSFREAEEASIELSHLACSPNAVKLAIQWMYSDNFLDETILENKESSITLEDAILVLELASAILCPRLCSHTANTVLIPALNDDNVFQMLDLAYTYNLTRLEDKCVEVFAMNLDTIAHRSEFQFVIDNEVAGTEQRGDVQITDIPIAAEIRSTIFRLITGDNARLEQIRRLKLLEEVIQRSIESKLSIS